MSDFLQPYSRLSLFEALRPPQGYHLDCAIGTTFSLDLNSLLTLPLAFTLFDIQDFEGKPVGESLAILETLRRHSENIYIFCQMGNIHVPKNISVLVSTLEDSVIQVTPPRDQGVFHPKTWALRFTNEEETVLYRFICSSRNLTLDRSWDTVVVLDGYLQERQRGFGKNKPLGDFVRSLPKLAKEPVSDRLLDTIELVQSEIRRVRFEPPLGFREIAFWPLGVEGYRKWPFPEKNNQMLVISPFLTKNAVERLQNLSKTAKLISRLESLQSLYPSELDGFATTYYLDPGVNLENEEFIDDETTSNTRTNLSGLHAKVYVFDKGSETRIFTGSANATSAAFSNNVEFLVELIGRKKNFGVDAILREDQIQVTLRSLLEEYIPHEQKPLEDDVEVELRNRIHQVRLALMDLRLHAFISPEEGETNFRIELRAKNVQTVEIPKGVDVSCWLITIPLRREAKFSFQGDVSAEFRTVAFESLSAFIAFRITAKLGSKTLPEQFVLHVPLVNAPKHRREKLLTYLLRDKQQVLRLLFLILADIENEPWREREIAHLLSSDRSELKNQFSATIFEDMVRALSRDPERLDQINALVESLNKTDEGRALLPDRFMSIWDPIWKARLELKE